MTEGHKRPDDHDLLIELNTKFSSIETSQDRMWRETSDKLSRILLQMDEKADKQTVKFVEQRVEKLEERMAATEADRIRDSVRRETVVSFGNIGIKTWGVIAGILALLMGFWEAVRG